MNGPSPAARLVLAALVGGLLLGLVAAVAIAVTRGGDAPGPARAHRPPASSTSPAAPTPTATSAPDEGHGDLFRTPAPGVDRDREVYTQVARDFAATWPAKADTPARVWSLDIRALCTGDLARGLEAADPRTLPVGEPGPVEVVEPGDITAAVRITIGEAGWVLRLVNEGDRWAVANIYPDQVAQ